MQITKKIYHWSKILVFLRCNNCFLFQYDTVFAATSSGKTNLGQVASRECSNIHQVLVTQKLSFIEVTLKYKNWLIVASFNVIQRIGIELNMVIVLGSQF